MSLEGVANNNNDPSQFPRVRYTDERGVVTVFDDRTGANPPEFRVGDRVTVLYKPGDAASAMIDRGRSNWEPVVMLVLLGSTFFALGAFSLRRA